MRSRRSTETRREFHEAFADAVRETTPPAAPAIPRYKKVNAKVSCARHPVRYTEGSPP